MPKSTSQPSVSILLTEVQRRLIAELAPKHEEHSSYLEWCGGSFDAEHFDAAEATRMMRRGLPDWRDFY